MQKKNILLVVCLLAILLVLFLFKNDQEVLNDELNQMATTSSSTSLNAGDADTPLLAVDDCSQEIPLDRIDDTSLDLDRTVTVYWLEENTQKNVSKRFIFDPKSDFVGCSESVKSKMRELDAVARDSYGDEYYPLFIE